MAQRRSSPSIPASPSSPHTAKAGRATVEAGEGWSWGVVVAIIAAAIAAVAFIMVDPMGLFGGKTGRDAATNCRKLASGLLDVRRRHVRREHLGGQHLGSQLERGQHLGTDAHACTAWREQRLRHP